MKKLHHPIFIKTVLATAIGAGLSAAPLLQAQEAGWALEEIVVTARKREENIQDVGQSVSALNETEISRSMAKDLRDLAGFAPNLIIDDASSGPGSPASISLRGISFQDVEKSFDPAVGVVVDGVFMGTNTGQMFTVLDLERVEVLRGPQGTLFGKNSIGGVINIVRTKPTNEFGGKVRVKLGEYDLRNIDAVVNVPVTEQLAVKLTGARHEQDGYFDNLTTGENDGEREYQSLGINLLFSPNDDVEIEYTFQQEEEEGDAPPLVNISQPGTALCDGFLQCAQSVTVPQAGDRFKTLADGANDAFIDTDSHIFEVRWAINESLDFDYIFGLRESDENIQQDFDASSAPFFQTERPQEYEQLSHEFRFTYVGDGMNLVAGIYSWESEYRLDQVTAINGAALPTVITRQEADTWAVFFEGDIDLSEAFTLTVGGRYTTEEKESGNSLPLAGLLNLDNPASEEWNEFTPKLGLRYQVTDDLMAYTTVSTGFRSGGFNGRAQTAAAALEPYDPETVENFEFGFKSDWLDSRLRFNAAYFYTSYDDKQEEIVRPVAPPVGQETVVANASNAIIQGIELEMQAYPMQGLKIRANLGLLDAEYDDFNADLNGDGNATDNSSLDLRRAPDLTFTVDTSYEWDVGAGIAWVQASYHYTDEYEATFFNTPHTAVDAMGIVDASINYEINGYQVSLFGRNLTDEDEWQHALDVAGLFSFAAPRAPRTAGVEFSKSF